MIVTILLGAAFYVTCVAVQVWGFGTDPAGLAAFTASSAPLGALAMAYVGPGLAAALYVAALISAVGAGLGCVLVAVRMLFALGRDGVLPAMLSRVCTRTGTPTTAVGVELAVGLVTITGFRLAGAAPARMFFVLATIGVLHLLAMYAITDVAAVRYLRRAGNGRWSLLAAAVGAVVAAAVLAQTLTTAPLALRLTVLGWLRVRSSSATDHAWNGQPVAACGGSPSAVSEAEPTPHSARCAVSPSSVPSVGIPARRQASVQGPISQGHTVPW
jgi:amino acid transporter